jgi:hypothetical protein
MTEKNILSRLPTIPKTGSLIHIFPGLITKNTIDGPNQKRTVLAIADLGEAMTYTHEENQIFSQDGNRRRELIAVAVSEEEAKRIADGMNVAEMVKADAGGER